MQLHFWPSNKERIVRSRRGNNLYRERPVPARCGVIEYPPLAQSVIELVEDGKIVGVYTSPNNHPRKAIMKDVRSQNQNGSDFGDGLKTENNDAVQSVVEELHPNGETIPGTDELSVPSLDEGNARLEQSEERGPESGPDGLHSNDDEPSVLHDRPIEGVGTVSTSVENS